nr:zinc finger, CCHC-type [Tanacetum cinerariifolium]
MGQHVAPKILVAHSAWNKESKEIAGLILMNMEPDIQRNLETLHAHEMLLELKTLFAQQVEHELFQTTRDFHSCNQEERQSVSSYVLKMKGYIDNLERLRHPLHEQTLPKNNAPALHAIQASKVQKVNKHKKLQPQIAARGQNHGKGKNKQAYALKPKISPLPKREDLAKDSIYHECSETGHWKRNFPQYLAELLKKKKNAASGAGGSDIFHKHEVYETFKVFQKEVENQLGKTIKSLRSDHGGEYMSQEFLDHRIIAHRTPPYTSQTSGVSKRRNRTLLDMVRSMMSQTTLPKSFWDYALETATRILNMVPTKKVKKTLYEVWHRKAPKLSYLRV